MDCDNIQLLKASLICLTLGIIEYNEELEENIPKKKKMWVKPWLLRHGTQGNYEKVYSDWKFTDPEMYRCQIRLYPEDFDTILRLVDPLIRKQDTNCRLAIPPDKRLTITLKHLATGETFSSLSGQFLVGHQTVKDIVKETCEALIKALRSETKTPRTEIEWKSIADDFWKLWDYPCCIGAIDGKHILIVRPRKEGSRYWNYKGQHSIVLMAVVGADLRFLYADVGINGRISDGGVWNRCSLKKAIDDNTLNVPPPHQNLPYHIVGDDAFPLSSHMMKPYPQHQLHHKMEKRVFNYRLSRARRISENAFGILVHRWGVFRAPIRTKPSKAVRTTLAALSLHNFLISTKQYNNRQHYKLDCPEKPAPGGITPLMQQFGNRSTDTAQVMRNSLANFFVNEGDRKFQYNFL